MKTFFVYTDGGASGNPGPAGIGAVAKLKSKNPPGGEAGEKLKTIFTISQNIGKATNNQAEYKALIKAMQELKKISDDKSEYQFFLDSELIVNQMNLKYKIKHPELQPLFLKAHNLATKLSNVKFNYIPREQNREADRLVKKAILKGKNEKT